MQADRAAATGGRRTHHFDLECVEHAGGGLVDVRQHGGLHAAFEHQHATGVRALRPTARALAMRHLLAQRARQQ